MSLKVSQIKSVLQHVIRNNRFLEERGKKKNSILIESCPGIGKTSVVQQIANEMGLSFVKINLSNIEQAGDICGFPIREFQCTDGRWINEKQLSLIAGEMMFSGKTRTAYCPPSWVPSDGRPTLLLLDDFTRAPMHIMQAVMEIIDRGEYISWRLPKDCHVMMTSNPSDSGDFFVTSLDSAQQTRYIRLKMSFDIDEWAIWAEREGIDTRCINFLLLNPEMIKDHVNARLATDYFNSISSIDDFSSVSGLELINLLGEGSVGLEFSSCFSIFVNNRLDKLPSPDFIFNNSSDEQVVNSIFDSVGSVGTQSYRQNIASLISTRIINFAQKIADEKTAKKNHAQRIISIIKSGVLSGDITYNLIKSINGIKQFSAVVEDKEVLKIITK